MQNNNDKRQQSQKPTEPKKSGLFNQETGKEIKTNEEFRQAFRQRKLVLNL